MIGDGFCNDEANNVDCNHDGGDCCVNLNKSFCTECNCISDGVITSPGYRGSTWLIEVSDGQRIEIRFLKFDAGPHSFE